MQINTVGPTGTWIHQRDNVRQKKNLGQKVSCPWCKSWKYRCSEDTNSLYWQRNILVNSRHCGRQMQNVKTFKLPIRVYQTIAVFSETTLTTRWFQQSLLTQSFNHTAKRIPKVKRDNKISKKILLNITRSENYQVRSSNQFHSSTRTEINNKKRK